MNRLPQLLLGPELLWAFFYLLIILIIKFTGSPVKSMDSFWIHMIYIMPLVFLPLTFGLYYVPGVIKAGLLLRIWFVGLVLGHFVLNKSLSVHSEGGPGVGTAYIVGMGIQLLVLVAGSIWAAVKFISKQ